MTTITLAKRMDCTPEQTQRVKSALSVVAQAIDGLSIEDKQRWRKIWNAYLDMSAGEVVTVDMKKMRNGKFFRKWWALAQVAYEAWTDGLHEVIVGGVPVQPTFERFRKDLTIKAGYFEAVYTIAGDVRLEAKSIAWSKMDEDEFEELYQKTINAVLSFVLAGRGMTAEILTEWVERVMEFS